MHWVFPKVIKKTEHPIGDWGLVSRSGRLGVPTSGTTCPSRSPDDITGQ